MRFSFIPLLILLLVSGGCSLREFAEDGESAFGTASCALTGQETVIVYLTNLGWHTGVVIPSELAKAELGSLISEFDSHRWVEIGWGDRDFYQASGYSYWAGLRALFFSSGSALHVAGVNTSPNEFFKEEQLCEIAVTKSNFAVMMQYIASHLVVGDSGHVNRLGSALYGSGSFYEASGNFSLSNTCNSWTARVFAAAGCEVNTNLILASSVFRALCVKIYSSN